MSTNQLYSLTWGDFGTSLVSAVQLLRCHGDLVDVTLAAGGRCFPAHKIVLCAASPFLLDLLKSTPCKHPVVMLAGVTASDLEALLEFVYRGEVSVDPNQLPSLLQAAHCLNIQGLAPASISDTHQNTLQQTIKAVIDIAKCDEMNQTATNEVMPRDVINSFSPLRSKKRMKRKSSCSSRSKWPRHDIAENTENRPVVQQSVTVNEHGEVMTLSDIHRKVDQNNSTTDTSTEVWNESELTFSNVSGSSRIVTSPDQLMVSTAHLPTHNITQVSATTNTSVTTMSKVKSASDQPGACPLCGAMLRQARNLRRHLLTSCKYRDTTEALQSTSPCTSSLQSDQNKTLLQSREPDLHQLQPVAMHTVERVAPSSAAHLENKTSVLTHISCNNMIITDCDNMNSTLK